MGCESIHHQWVFKKKYMIDHIAVISWYTKIIKDLLSTGYQTSLFISTDTIIIGLMDIIIISPWKKIALLVPYYFNNILKLFFINSTSSTWLHVNLILHPLHFVIQKLSRIKLSYLLMERKLVLIYWMMNILQSLISLIKWQNFHPVIKFQHKLRKICGLFTSMENISSQLKARSMNSSAIGIDMENTSSRSVYAEWRATRGQILNRFGLDLIKSNL